MAEEELKNIGSLVMMLYIDKNHNIRYHAPTKPVEIYGSRRAKAIILKDVHLNRKNEIEEV